MSFWTWTNYRWIREMMPSLKNQHDIVTGLWKTDEKWENTYKWDRSESLISNQNTILMKVLENASTYNKWKEKPLYKFIKDFISNLSITESSELLAKLYYYLEVYEMQDEWWSEKLDDKIIPDFNSHSMWEIMYELLITNVYLPEYENQKQFSADMNSLIIRFEKRITKFRLWQKPLVFSPINHRSLLDYMDNNNGSVIKWVKHLDKGIVKRVWYKFALNERDSLEEENEFYFEFLLDSTFNISNDKKKEKLFNREEYIRHLTDDLSKKDLLDGKNFYYTEDSLFRYTVYVWENFYKASDDVDSEWFSNEIQDFWYEVRVMANPKNDLDPEETFANVCRRLPWLTEQILEDIYESYWRWPDWNRWYPSKPEIFDLSRIINAEEKKDWYIKDFNEWSWDSLNPDDRKIIDFVTIDEIPDLVLTDRVREEADKLIHHLNFPELYSVLNLNYPKWILFFWAPWTGKTSLGMYIAAKTNKNVLFGEVLIDKIKWEFVWQSEKWARRLFEVGREEVAKWNIVILYMPEIDWFMSAWGMKNDTDAGMRSVILSEIDWILKNKNEWIIIIWDTNYIGNINDAFRKRFDRELKIDLPDEKWNRTLIKMYMDVHWDDIFDISKNDIKVLARETKWEPHRFFKQWLMNIVSDYVYTENPPAINIGDFRKQLSVTRKQEEDRGKVIRPVK